MTPKQKRKPNKKHKINHEIKASQVRLIDELGQQQGVVPRSEALRIAEEKDLDLVEIAPGAKPPVCRLLVYSKFVYEEERRAKQNKAAQSKPPSQIQFQPGIAEHDYETKRRQTEKMLVKGEKVKINVRMKGRQKAHPELAKELIERFCSQVPGVVESAPKQEGDKFSVTLSPDKAKIQALQAKKEVAQPSVETE